MVEKIVALARLRGFDQGDVERSIDLPRGRISKWLSGQGEPTARQVLKVARLLDVSVESLIDDELEAKLGSGGEERAIIHLYKLLRNNGLDVVERYIQGSVPIEKAPAAEKQPGQNRIVGTGGNITSPPNESEPQPAQPPRRGSKQA